MTALPSVACVTSPVPTDVKTVQPADCDILMRTNESTKSYQSRPEPIYVLPEHDLSRLDLNESLQSAEHIRKDQPIALPTIPPDSFHPFSSSFDLYGLLSNCTSDHDDEQPIKSQPFTSSNQTDISPSIPSGSVMSSKFDNTKSVPLGVDWSDCARPTSHCWFSSASDDPLSAPACAYPSCANRKSIDLSPLLYCESCDLVVHWQHLNDSSMTDVSCLPPCRPSFVDTKDDPSRDDQHFWSQVSVLPKPCICCQRTSIATPLFGSESGSLSMMSALDIPSQFVSFISSIQENFNPKLSESSSGLVCLWCSVGYHQSCWERLAAQADKSQCDYGMFRDIIVRPQWLSRSSEFSGGFRAQLPSRSAFDNSKSKASPYTPLLVFINKRSGGQVGEKIYRKLLRILNPRQVFLLENNDTITHALNIYNSLANTRICVFGGDGTVGWVLGRLAETYPSGNNPPVSICPLGTGNDLSRVLDWGDEYDPKRLLQTLLQTHQAQEVVLDRWEVSLDQFDMSSSSSPEQNQRVCGLPISQTFQSFFNQHPKFIYETNREYYQNHHNLPNTRFINYMSFGLDAAIALDFHDERTRDPSKFSSPLKNKLMYLNESCKYFTDFARANMWNLGSYIRLICDGRNMTDAIRDCHTLVVLNIPGYASGTKPWGQSSSGAFDLFESLADIHETYRMNTLSIGTSNQTASSSATTVSTNHFERQSFGDRKIEVVGLNTAQMAAIHIGVRGNRIAQCSQVRIELCNPMTAQMDGEPFYLPAAVAVNISHAGQVLVLSNENK